MPTEPLPYSSMIKKLFAIFCAFCLLPLVSAQAWIGGPYSNNSYFGVGGDDGIYEAVATTTNGLGLYRIVVGNSFAGVNPTGVQASVPSQRPNTGTPLTVAIQVPGINSGNIFFGGLGSNQSNIWYFQGVSYFGNAIGTVNSVAGIATAVGKAFVNPGNSTTAPSGNSVSSFFQAQTVTSGAFLPAKAFTGTGELRVSTAPAVAIPFTIFGNRVSDQILYGL